MAQTLSLLVIGALLGTPPPSERFVGGLLGVHADVLLCVQNQHAEITLSGIPLGGTLRGSASFADGEGSNVVIDEPLRSALRRRFVKVVGAKWDRSADKVILSVKLPLAFGTHTITLLRATSAVQRAPACVPEPPGFLL